MKQGKRYGLKVAVTGIIISALCCTPLWATGNENKSNSSVTVNELVEKPTNVENNLNFIVLDSKGFPMANVEFILTNENGEFSIAKSDAKGAVSLYVNGKATLTANHEGYAPYSATLETKKASTVVLKHETQDTQDTQKKETGTKVTGTTDTKSEKIKKLQDEISTRQNELKSLESQTVSTKDTNRQSVTDKKNQEGSQENQRSQKTNSQAGTQNVQNEIKGNLDKENKSSQVSENQEDFQGYTDKSAQTEMRESIRQANEEIIRNSETQEEYGYGYGYQDYPYLNAQKEMQESIQKANEAIIQSSEPEVQKQINETIQKSVPQNNNTVTETTNQGPATTSSSASNGSADRQWPLEVGTISSDYKSASRPNHTGTDIAAPTGTPVKAMSGGTVISAGWNGNYGNEVVIDHGDGTQTRYAHMSSIDVSKGATVSGSQQVGKVGSTGNSTGPHLHFEVMTSNGTFMDPVGYVGA